MSGWLILFVGFVYLIVAVQLFFKGNIGLSIAFISYSIANIGLYMAGEGL